MCRSSGRSAQWPLRYLVRLSLGPRAERFARGAPRRSRAEASRARARARAQLRRWVTAHAGSDAPAVARWMVSAGMPGADEALQWMRDAIELPLATDTWRTSQASLIAASISHSAAVDRETWDAAAEVKDAADEQYIKAIFQASEAEDWLMLQVDELCRDKRQEDWEDRLLVMGHAAVDKYSSLDDVPHSIRTHSPRVSGSHGHGGSGASWGPRVSRRRRLALPHSHENVAPYEPAHVGISSMRFVPDLTSSRLAATLTSRPKAIARIEI